MLMTPGKNNQEWLKANLVLPMLHNTPITLTKEIKYLGIIFDRQMLFQKHIEAICSKTKKLLFPVLKAVRQRYGISRTSVHTAYQSSLLPMLTYGAVAWGDAVKQKKRAKMLDSIQHLVLIKATGMYATASYSKIRLLAGCPKISVQVTHRFSWTREFLNNEEVEMSLDSGEAGHPGSFQSIGYDKYSASFSKMDLNYYTDGSKADGHVGAGLYGCDKNDSEFLATSFSLDCCCSVYQA